MPTWHSPFNMIDATMINAAWKPTIGRQLFCLLIIGVFAWMIDLKGITTDEGFRLWIINGGQPALPSGLALDATWERVIAANAPYAYQPLYFLIQNGLMRLADTHSLLFFRSVNLVFLWVALQGLLALSRDWRPAARLFLLGLFSFNAYLFMHVLQIREYTAGVAFYIWTSWLVLRLDARRLERPWTDTAWFTAYGLALVVGFYLQSWTVFPAAAQGLFLVLRRPGDRLRFYSYLALTYVIVITAVWPYLQDNQQKINIGLWAREQEPVHKHLFIGFHLLLTGHLPGVFRLADGLFWFWSSTLVGGLLWLMAGRTEYHGTMPRREIRRQVLLLLLCLGVSVTFQITYALKVENLSLWPRYFIIHYFFLMWLGALVFHRLLDLRASTDAPPIARRVAIGVLTAMAVVLAVSTVFQIRNFRRDPMLDMAETTSSNWRIWAEDLMQKLRPGDVVLVPDFIRRSTLSFTRPMTNRILLLDELETSDLRTTDRLVYMESSASRHERELLIDRTSALGFSTWQELKIISTDGSTVLPEWQFIVFTR